MEGTSNSAKIFYTTSIFYNKFSKRDSIRANIKKRYNEEFDPGSGWTLATGLTHASRGAARE